MLSCQLNQAPFIPPSLASLLSSLCLFYSCSYPPFNYPRPLLLSGPDWLDHSPRQVHKRLLTICRPDNLKHLLCARPDRSHPFQVNNLVALPSHLLNALSCPTVLSVPSLLPSTCPALSYRLLVMPSCFYFCPW